MLAPMNATIVFESSPTVPLPNIPTVLPRPEGALWLAPDGEVETVPLEALAARIADTPVLVCHARAVMRRLRVRRLAAFDVLELFAFVYPARACLPTPEGLAAVTGLPRPTTPEQAALTLRQAASRLLLAVAGEPREPRSDPSALAHAMGQGGWAWGPFVLAARGEPNEIPVGRRQLAWQAWRGLTEWAAEAPEPPPGQVPVSAAEARTRLAALLLHGSRGAAVEPRPQQADFASAVSLAFTPRESADGPNLVLAEAGTGVGKTLGYLAPATLWAEKNKAAVWVSTFTRNLQTQIDAELDRLHVDPSDKARRVVVRKGRENYLCLLNFEDATRQATLNSRQATALGLMARWIAVTRDGDLKGADFPGWLPDLLGQADTLGLADRRGECVYSACEHYNRCFIERSIRRARRAHIVIANHALVMVRAALGTEDGHAPTRYVFDEGHHLFDAADSAFSGHLSARETAELRRWLLGAEGERRSRARGLRRRLDDLVGPDGPEAAFLDQVLTAARTLPGEGWAARLAAGTPRGPAEVFLSLVRRQVLARAVHVDGPYSVETEPQPAMDGVAEAALALDQALGRLAAPLVGLAGALATRLDAEADQLDSEQRRRIDAMARGLERRAAMDMAMWRGMLTGLSSDPGPGFVDWFGIERADGREVDVGFHRHYVDPMRPFARIVAAPAHGVVVTSATLTDGTGDTEHDWRTAENRCGAVHLPTPAMRASVPSPFDYAAQTRIFVITDLRKDDADQVGAAYRELFRAAGGGGLGLFTNIGRLRAVHSRIAGALETDGIPLLAQHVDGLSREALIDIFRAEPASCLLGTDAVRDGVDVPGRSLRLIVFDRVPWPQPSLLHKARRDAFGGRKYDEMVVRLRLKQAFGRLVRRSDDQGVFVLLDAAMPSRLYGAFPEGIGPERVGLAEAVRLTAAFLDRPAG